MSSLNNNTELSPNDNDLLSGLNDEQRAAAETTEGYVRVVAGAGSGKTRALTYRFAHLVTELSISTSRILCVTFTNKAANEMKKRIRRMIGDRDLSFICTFHGFCVQLLREDCHIVQYPREFVIYDNADQRIIISQCFERLGITSKDMTIETAMDAIKTFKDGDYVHLLTDVNMAELLELRKTANELKIKVIYEYLYEQRKSFGFDFDDLINFALFILETDTDTRVKWQKRIEYIMIDEFQDVNDKQYKLASILSDYHGNLFVVGDPDQTIYSWRGANLNYILKFDEKYPSCETIVMNKNYRSLQQILAPSNALIRKNEARIDKDLIAVRTETGQALYFHGKTQTEEATWVTDQIAALQEQGASLANIAVLYRAHFVSRPFEEAFLTKKLPYILYSGTPFYRRKEIKDILCYMQMVLNSDDLSFTRIVNEPKRGIGKTRMDFLREYAEKHSCSLYEALTATVDDKRFTKTKAKDFIGLIERYRAEYHLMTLTDFMLGILRESGYEEQLRVAGDEERLDNLAELKQSIYSYETTAGEETNLETYLQSIALFTNEDIDDNKEAIKMMTIHSAKGLEFPYVFVCGMNEGIFPSKKSNTVEKLEEERRLAYVAFTRAEDKLFLTESEGLVYGDFFRYPSRFIFDAEKANLEYVVELDKKLEGEARSHIGYQVEIALVKSDFNADDIIFHPHFGRGVVLEVDTDGSCYLIKFDKMKTPRSIDFRAKLRTSE